MFLTTVINLLIKVGAIFIVTSGVLDYINSDDNDLNGLLLGSGFVLVTSSVIRIVLSYILPLSFNLVPTILVIILVMNFTTWFSRN